MPKVANRNFICDLKIVIPQLPCLINIVNTVESKLVLGNSATTDSVTSLDFALCNFVSRCFPMELVPCYDGC